MSVTYHMTDYHKIKMLRFFLQERKRLHIDAHFLAFGVPTQKKRANDKIINVHVDEFAQTKNARRLAQRKGAR
jgi:hypothetical protein